MNTMNDIDVVINNKKFTLSGYESEEYLQKVASYINGKYQEFQSTEFYHRLEPELKGILLEINIADDYFKVKSRLNEVEEESSTKSSEIFNLKHDIISSETKISALEQELDELKKKFQNSQNRIIKLETELEDSMKQQNNFNTNKKNR